VKLEEVLAYTAPDNLLSQAVIQRLNLERDASRDFTADDPRLGMWRGMVWVARPDWQTQDTAGATMSR
jgi:RimJ/RimL family protein N-acetyltransferase